MRPKSKLIFVMILLSAVLCEIAELRLTQPKVKIYQRTEINQASDSSPHIYNITFEEFKEKYHKHYSSIAQQSYRKLIFQQNLDQLNRHNLNPGKKYSKKPNAFLDVNQEEFKSVYTTVHPSDRYSRNVSQEIRKKGQYKGKQKHKHPSQSDAKESFHDSQVQNDIPQNSTEDQRNTQDSINASKPERRVRRNLQSQTNTLPEVLQNEDIQNSSILNKTITPISQSNIFTSTPTISNLSQSKNIYIDWSAYSGPVRYQGYCGACYAFASVDTLAAHLAIYLYDFFMSLSIQQIVDCAKNELTFGCNGGYLEGALTYIQMNGIVSDALYPFTSGNNGAANTCKIYGGSFKLSSFQPIEQGSCSSVITQLYRGPISAGISGYNLRFYDQGIFDDCTKKDPLDHAVMIIGYESGKGWRIKNSWGSDWGENGYGWIAEGNTCWICNMTVSIVI